MATTAKSPALKPSRTRASKTTTAVADSNRPSAAAAAVEAPPKTEPVSPTGKLGMLVGLLRREADATLADMTAATGWQAHSVRGALAGSLKKKLGLPIISEKAEGVRVYRIAA